MGKGEREVVNGLMEEHALVNSFSQFERTVGLSNALLTGSVNKSLLTLREEAHFESSGLFERKGDLWCIKGFSHRSHTKLFLTYNVPIDGFRSAVQRFYNLVGLVEVGRPDMSLDETVFLWGSLVNGRSLFIDHVREEALGPRSAVTFVRGGSTIFIPVLLGAFEGDQGSDNSRLLVTRWLSFGCPSYKGFKVEEYLNCVGIGMFTMNALTKVDVSDIEGELDDLVDFEIAGLLNQWLAGEENEAVYAALDKKILDIIREKGL